MKPIMLLGSFMLIGLGCSRPMVPPPVTLAERTASSPSHAEPMASVDGEALRKSGDYVVMRFSGSYRDHQATMTQHVVATYGGITIIDMNIDDGGEQLRLRLRLDSEGNALSVAKFEGAVQRPFGVAAYEQLMNGIILSADDNTGLVSTGETIVDIAGMPLAVTESSYRVRVGAHQAVMKTMSAEDFAWGDVGGEIRTLDGQLLYKAEIIELGKQPRTMAAHGVEDIYEGYDFLDDI